MEVWRESPYGHSSEARTEPVPGLPCASSAVRDLPRPAGGSPEGNICLVCFVLGGLLLKLSTLLLRLNNCRIVLPDWLFSVCMGSQAREGWGCLLWPACSTVLSQRAWPDENGTSARGCSWLLAHGIPVHTLRVCDILSHDQRNHSYRRDTGKVGLSGIPVETQKSVC